MGEVALLHQPECLVERLHVVVDLDDVAALAHDRLVLEQVGERGLRPLDAGGEHRLPVLERLDEQPEVRERLRRADEHADGAVGLAELLDEGAGERQLPGERGGDEGELAVGDGLEPADGAVLQGKDVGRGHGVAGSSGVMGEV